jgi:hypothetical protein
MRTLVTAALLLAAHDGGVGAGGPKRLVVATGCGRESIVRMSELEVRNALSNRQVTIARS